MQHTYNCNNKSYILLTRIRFDALTICSHTKQSVKSHCIIILLNYRHIILTTHDMQDGRSTWNFLFTNYLQIKTHLNKTQKFPSLYLK
jgi:hypothetical protein